MNKTLIQLFSKQVGEDQFGNKYFIGNNTNYLGKHKRFVIYHGINESSKVPPVWHAWLHCLNDTLPPRINTQYNWQQVYTPNLTGTKHAYTPSNTLSRKKLLYAPWSPNQKIKN